MSTPALASARELHDEIEACALTIDRERHIPEPLISKLRNAGFFRLLVPKSMGGSEMDWRDYLDVIVTISHADGSVGWCINQGAVFATNSARNPRKLAEKIWSDPRTVVGNGPPSAVHSERVNGGFELTGRWNFSSGCRHANWLAALAGRGDAPTKLHFIPAHELDLIDVWQVQGLRGTGSFSFAADRHFVPDEHVMPMNLPIYEPGPLYVIPQALMFACGFGCVALGVARSALDGILTLSREKTPQFSRSNLAKDAVIQTKIGQSEAKWQAAKALLMTSVESIWERVQAKSSIEVDDRIQLRMAGTHAIRESAAVVDVLYNLAGSTSIFEQTHIQRRFQDIHVITQQVQGREAHYQTVGAHYLGEEAHGIY